MALCADHVRVGPSEARRNLAPSDPAGCRVSCAPTSKCPTLCPSLLGTVVFLVMMVVAVPHTVFSTQSKTIFPYRPPYSFSRPFGPRAIHLMAKFWLQIALQFPQQPCSRTSPRVEVRRSVSGVGPLMINPRVWIAYSFQVLVPPVPLPSDSILQSGEESPISASADCGSGFTVYPFEAQCTEGSITSVG